MDDERPRDVRDSLSELEQRLLELERELRADAARDAGAAGEHVAVPPSVPAAATGTIEVEREPAAPPIADQAAATQPSTDPPAPVPTVQPDAAHPPAPAPTVQPDVGPLVDETRRKVDALRTSLDGLTGASDRLREVAQVVVEDHGRALVRLERATTQQQARTFAPATSDEPAGATGGPPPPSAPARRRGRGWAWAALAALLAGGVLAAAVVLDDRDEPTTTTTVPGSMSRIALTPELGPDTRAFTSVPGTRPASDAGAVDDLCDGIVGAAVVVRPSGADALPPCAAVVTVSSGTVSALALAERSSSRKRSCVNAADVPSIAASRPDRRRTVARDAAVQRATTRAELRTRNAGLTPGERVGKVHTAAYRAGRRFDARQRLRLLAVRATAKGACVVPGRDDVASGRYPLASRVELLALESTRDQPAVDRAAVVIEHLTSGPAPISATVLRRKR